MQAYRVVEGAIARLRRAEDVGGKLSAAGARFDEIESGFGIRDSGFSAEQPRHLRELDLEELAEERADVDAGKKIARAARTSGGAGVVAELRIVEGELHERGHRDRAALTNHIRNQQSAIINLS